LGHVKGESIPKVALVVELQEKTKQNGPPRLRPTSEYTSRPVRAAGAGTRTGIGTRFHHPTLRIACIWFLNGTLPAAILLRVKTQRCYYHPSASTSILRGFPPGKIDLVRQPSWTGLNFKVATRSFALIVRLQMLMGCR
jgi:hypothetical protein